MRSRRPSASRPAARAAGCTWVIGGINEVLMAADGHLFSSYEAELASWALVLLSAAHRSPDQGPDHRQPVLARQRSGVLWLQDSTASPAEFGRPLVAAARRSITGALAGRRYQQRRMLRVADRDINAAEFAAIAGDWQDTTWDGLTGLPKPVWVYRTCSPSAGTAWPAAAEVGKSLLVRDWLIEVAPSGGNAYVSYASLSEGEFDLQEPLIRALPLFEKAGPFLHFLGGVIDLVQPRRHRARSSSRYRTPPGRQR